MGELGREGIKARNKGETLWPETEIQKRGQNSPINNREINRIRLTEVVTPIAPPFSFSLLG